MANLCIIQTYQSFFRKWSERHRARAAGVEQHRDLSGGGGDQDDEAGQELGGVRREGEPEGVGGCYERDGEHSHPYLPSKHF